MSEYIRLLVLLVWAIVALVSLVVTIRARCQQRNRPPLQERIRHAMDKDFTARVRRRRDLPERLEFDFLFEVTSKDRCESLVSALQAIGYSATIECNPSLEVAWVEAVIESSPADIDFVSVRKQLQPLCVCPEISYAGLGKRSYRAAGIDTDAIMSKARMA